MTDFFYLDTNVYRHITACEEASKVRSAFLASNIKVIASSSNLFETFAISDIKVRKTEMTTLTTVSSKFHQFPESWHQAKEVRDAIQKHRRSWIRPLAYTRNEKKFLQQHLVNWQAALQGEFPPPDAYSQFRKDFETGVANASNFQKSLRSEHLAKTLKLEVINARSGTSCGNPFDMNDPEAFWRAECLLAWSEAIINESPSSRDYSDWLAPYLKRGVFLSNDYPSLWLADIGQFETPKNRLSSLITYFQLEAKITHGNSVDSFHACHALDVQHFFTADRVFYETLYKTSKYFPRFASLHFVDRAAQSTLPFFEKAMNGR